MIGIFFFALWMQLPAQEPEAQELEHLWRLQSPELTAPSRQITPILIQTPVPPHPLDRRLSLGWQAVRLADPFSSTTVSTSGSSPRVALYLGGKTWSIQAGGQLLFSGVDGRIVDASLFGPVPSIGPVAIDLGVQFQETRFTHDAFRYGGADISTKRLIRSEIAALGIGIGDLDRTNIRLSGLFGYYESVYWSVFQAPQISDLEVLDKDMGHVRGVGLTIRNWMFWQNRGRLDGSLQYLQRLDQKAPMVPRSEFTGTTNASVRMFSKKPWDLYLGATFSFGSSDPSLIANRTLGVSATWRHQ